MNYVRNIESAWIPDEANQHLINKSCTIIYNCIQRAVRKLRNDCNSKLLTLMYIRSYQILVVPSYNRYTHQTEKQLFEYRLNVLSCIEYCSHPRCFEKRFRSAAANAHERFQNENLSSPKFLRLTHFSVSLLEPWAVNYRSRKYRSKLTRIH